MSEIREYPMLAWFTVEATSEEEAIKILNRLLEKLAEAVKGIEFEGCDIDED